MFRSANLAAALLLLSPGVLGQAFGLDTQVEPADFDVKQALLEQDVDVSKFSALADPAGNGGAADCAAACTVLGELYGDQVLAKGQDAHLKFTTEYWSQQQAELQPACIVNVPTSKAVSVTVLLSRLTQCPFAAKSGGHSRFAGASSSDGGILLSFANLNGVKASADRKTVAVGPGNTWSKAYEETAKKDLTIVGGRVAAIGVGGLTTGGGISFFSNVHGWACDNIDTYEVVLASGQMVNATATHNEDLYWALRGGGPNFGLVTTFHHNAIELPNGAELWGGTRYYMEDSFDGLTDAFSNLIVTSDDDPKAGAFLVFLHYNHTDMGVSTLWYTEPNGGGAAIFEPYMGLNHISDDTANISHPDFAWSIEKGNPKGLREEYAHLTTKADPALLKISREIFYEEIKAILHVTAILPTLVFQGITRGQLAGMQRNGGNPLGLDPEEPLYIILLNSMWIMPTDDALVIGTMTKILNRIRQASIERGAKSDFVYMNYAGVSQDVIASYGLENKARLKQIAEKYDPKGVFQTLMPGYFKLDRAPTTGTGYYGDGQVTGVSAEGQKIRDEL